MIFRSNWFDDIYGEFRVVIEDTADGSIIEIGNSRTGYVNIMLSDLQNALKEYFEPND